MGGNPVDLGGFSNFHTLLSTDYLTHFMMKGVFLSFFPLLLLLLLQQPQSPCHMLLSSVSFTPNELSAENNNKEKDGIHLGKIVKINK